MSVTVEDLLSLPSLRNAEVAAGRGGLSRIVSSISVLESIDPGALNDALFKNDAFNGGEVVITSFINGRDDVELQCSNIRRLAEGGEVGLILFYVGTIMREIDRRLIELADGLGFPLICMPRNRMDLRYSEVISDVMEAILKDQSSGTSMVTEILERITYLPQHQRTVDTVIKMLSDRVKATVILTDASLNILNEAAWPRTLGGMHRHLRQAQLPKPMGVPKPFPHLPGGLMSRAQIKSERSQGMELFIIRDGEPLSPALLQQSGEIGRLAVSLWSRQHDSAGVSELVKAIMQDEPLKMRRLADLFQIDIASVKNMWIVTAHGGAAMTGSYAETVQDSAKEFCRTAFADLYEDRLVLFMDGPYSLSDAEALREAIWADAPAGIRLTVCRNLKDTAGVREAFYANAAYLADAAVLFPRRAVFLSEDIAFAQGCRQIIAGGEASVASARSALSPLDGARDADELKRTLAVYLLDTDGSPAETSERMHLHKNTIKYRLKCMADCFGFRVGTMPATHRLYQAAGVERLLSSRNPAE
jgi:DNA-binding PucR family transcriptional regulator